MSQNLRRKELVMANLDDLNYSSILDMDNDEAIETLRQIRLSRRESKRVVKTVKAKQTIPDVSSIDASELLRLLQEVK
jgi:hypothetical protein